MFCKQVLALKYEDRFISVTLPINAEYEIVSIDVTKGT
jgi:hypothetical protein